LIGKKNQFLRINHGYEPLKMAQQLHIYKVERNSDLISFYFARGKFMKKGNDYLLISALILLIIQVGMYFTIDSRNLLFVLNIVILIGVILFINKKSTEQSVEKDDHKASDAQIIEKM
jgi:hypothetical protein